ncbi:MAG TPA: hypothetical protein VK946_00210, partial [Methylotenera sp.]|nr:hypothetical protein [Methylotenera sp.]
DDGDSCDTRKLVSKDNWSKIHVPAGKRIKIEQGFDTRGLNYGIYCGLALSFIPEEDLTYVAEYKLQGSQCHISLFRITDTGERKLEPSTTTEKRYSCWLGNG